MINLYKWQPEHVQSRPKDNKIGTRKVTSKRGFQNGLPNANGKSFSKRSNINIFGVSIIMIT